MSMFNLKETKIYQALKWEWVFNIIAFLERAFLIGAVFSLLAFFILHFLSLLGFLVIFLSLTIWCRIFQAFFNLKLKKPSSKIEMEKAFVSSADFNLAEFLSFETAKAVFKAMKAVQNETPDSTTLFYWLLQDNPSLKFIFSRLLLDFESIKKILESAKETTIESNFSKIIFTCLETAHKRGSKVVSAGDFLVAFSKLDPIFIKILIEADFSSEDIENLVIWQETWKEKAEAGKRFWEMENLTKRGSLGRDWAAGYSITLDRYSLEWTAAIKKRGEKEIVGHQEEIQRLEELLSRQTLNSVLLIGRPGSGRDSVVQALAKKILFGKSLPLINYKRIVELDLPSLLAGSETQEQAETLLDQVFKEVVLAGNIILIIDDFPNYVAGLRRPGTINIAGILSKYLKLVSFQLIGICDVSEFHRYVEQNSALLSFFEQIEVSEISEKETMLILANQVPLYEKKYGKFISYQALRDIIKYCARYFGFFPFPKKAIDLLDEVMVYVSRDVKVKIVLPEHIAKVVTQKTKIPVGELEAREKETLLNLETLIHQRIINQEEAVKEISEAMRRARADITIRKGPIGAFLFLGPTGVGKTESSKALAEMYFGSEERMIRLDMSEFQEIKDISRLIGAPEKEGLLTTKVIERPFSLILLDEIEKAHPDILNLFLQVIDEGHLTDGVGRKIDFKNSIIIATSNAGYQIILKALREKEEWSKVKEELLDHLFEKAIFRPEFINRFDAVVVFRALTRENLLDIAQLMLEKLKKNLWQKHIEFIITDSLKEKIVALGYNPIFGAREMRRVIQDKVENVLAKALLGGELKRGDKIKISDDFQIIKM